MRKSGTDDDYVRHQRTTSKLWNSAEYMKLIYDIMVLHYLHNDILLN